MNISLILAVFWVGVGVTLLILDPPSFRFRLGGGSFSAGWAAFVLAAWNLVRWWSYRSSRRQRQAVEDATRERARREREWNPEERNPDFDFGDRQ